MGSFSIRATIAWFKKKTVLLKFSMFPTSGFKLQLHLIPTYLYIFEEIRANFHFAQVAAAYYVHYSQMCIHFGLFSTFLSLCIPGVILCIHGKMDFIGCLKKLS